MSGLAAVQRVCYRCGSPATTREHVVPRCLYPDPPAHKLLTVPACRDCNNALTKDEEYFRTVLASAWIESDAARKVAEQKVHPSFNRPERDGLRKLLLANSRDIYLPSNHGFVLTAILKADGARMDRVAEKIVRGLYYHETKKKKVMPPDAKMQFSWQPKEWLPDLALSGPWGDVDPKVFLYHYVITPDHSRSIWWMVFYKSFMYVVVAEAPVTVAREEMGG